MRTTLSFISIGTLFCLTACGSAPATQEELEAEEQEISASFLELLEMGEDYSCTFTDENGNPGTIYIGDAGERMRGDFMIDGKSSHMIHAENMTHIWMDGEPEGFKMEFDPEEDTLFGMEPGETSDTISIDENEPIDFTCTEWNVNPDMFEIPENVTFQDFGAMFKGMMQDMPTGDMPTADCSVCDQAPEAQRGQCRAAMGC